MRKIQIILAIVITKIVAILSKLLGNKSSAMPGKIARTIYPNILTYLWKQIKKETIIVTGTNGKTTTNNMLRDIIKHAGFKVICNDVGANMLNGIVSAFVNSSNLLGKIDASYACIEVDEASLLQIIDMITPGKIVITNLFRDQLDRYGEIDSTINKINSALEKVKDKKVELIINADDPLVAQFKFNHNFNTFFYGISEYTQNDIGDDSREGRFCTFCGEELVYNTYYYSQLGDYYCKNCDFKRPNLDYSISDINLSQGIKFNLSYDNLSEEISINYFGLYNVYNCLAAISTALNMKIDINIIRTALNAYKPQIGRMEKFNLPKPIILNLSKNPAGFNQTIDTVILDQSEKNIMIVINDNAQDGKDISWLWDCDFEKFLNNNVNKFIVSGIRKEDMAVRLKYAEIPLEKIVIEDDIKKAIFKMFDENIEIGYILVNYTALFETQNILKSLEKAYGLDVK